MKLSEKINFIIYRIRERGLEVFLLSHEEGEEWHIPQGKIGDHTQQVLYDTDKVIELDPVLKENNLMEGAVAMEADWHEIPSLKNLLRQDLGQFKGKLDEVLPELEHGSFVAVKEALRRVMPHQYAFLKELKEIIVDRNSVKDL